MDYKDNMEVNIFDSSKERNSAENVFKIGKPSEKDRKIAEKEKGCCDKKKMECHEDEPMDKRRESDVRNKEM
ncbi:hypothetical protein GCK72_020432 [Caenorhabditis remanei]|nr:hypothetical protein GCK72_020432 [Caenorhabditis remanei]KAF1753875.1 hypothetical protein GCK72_020432 [Caenorhabditis remanei]